MAFTGLQNANDCRGLREEVRALFFFTMLHESLLATSLRHPFESTAALRRPPARV
jgi:hypothetical protein